MNKSDDKEEDKKQLVPDTERETDRDVEMAHKVNELPEGP